MKEHDLVAVRTHDERLVRRYSRCGWIEGMRRQHQTIHHRTEATHPRCTDASASTIQTQRTIRWRIQLHLKQLLRRNIEQLMRLSRGETELLQHPVRGATRLLTLRHPDARAALDGSLVKVTFGRRHCIDARGLGATP